MADEQTPISAGRMAITFGVPERTLQRILMEAGVKNTPGKGYDFEASIKATVAHYRAKAEALDTEEAQHANRRTKAEADTAELNAGKAAERLVFRSDASGLWSDYFAKLRVCISTARFLKADQKAALIRELLSLNLDELKDEDAEGA